MVGVTGILLPDQQSAGGRRTPAWETGDRFSQYQSATFCNDCRGAQCAKARTVTGSGFVYQLEAEKLATYFFCGGTSVQLPCAISAAMPMLSPSVGCGGRVLPIPAAPAPIAMARAIPPIMSPACVPTMPPPRILPGPWASGESSNSSLVTPSSRPLAMARPEAVQGNRPFLTLMPCALAWSSVRPTHATSGSV